MFQSPIITSDGTIEWIPYSPTDILCSRFSINEWNKIVADISNDDDWRKFLRDYKEYVSCYILSCSVDHQKIGFAYLYKESEGVVSFHGGGWEKSFRFTILYYRGIITFIKYLIEKGYKVRTSCFIENLTALRFLRSIGFVIYAKTERMFYMWINKNRITHSKTSLWIYNKTIKN